MVRALASHQCAPGSIPVRCQTWVELLVVLDLLRVFFFGFTGFPPSAKTNISKFQFDHNRGPVREKAKADVTSTLNIVSINALYPRDLVT